MNSDLIMKLLRAGFTAALAYGAGRGWFKITAADSATLLQAFNDAAPILIGIATTFYANFAMKNVPKNSVAIDIGPQVSPADKGERVAITSASGPSASGKIVGAVLIGFLILAAPRGADAQSAPTSACNLDTMFKGMVPSNFMARAKACGIDDITNALIIANTSPIDYQALSCFMPLKTIQQAAQLGGVFTLAQAFRNANRDGFPQSCVDWAKSTVRMMVVVP